MTLKSKKPIARPVQTSRARFERARLLSWFDFNCHLVLDTWEKSLEKLVSSKNMTIFLSGIYRVDDVTSQSKRSYELHVTPASQPASQPASEWATISIIQHSVYAQDWGACLRAGKRHFKQRFVKISRSSEARLNKQNIPDDKRDRLPSWLVGSRPWFIIHPFKSLGLLAQANGHLKFKGELLLPKKEPSGGSSSPSPDPSTIHFSSSGSHSPSRLLLARNPENLDKIML